MDLITRKVTACNKEFIKLIYLENNSVINYLIYEKKNNEKFIERFTDEFEINEINEIMDLKNEANLSENEKKKFKEEFENNIKKSKEKFELILKNNNNFEDELILFDNIIGISYGVFKLKNDNILQVLNIHTDENGEIRLINNIPKLLEEQIIIDIIMKCKLTNKQHYISVNQNYFYGVRTEGDIIIVTPIFISEEKFNMIKSFVIKKTKRKFEFLDNTEIDANIKSKIEKNAKTLLNGLINEFGKDVL